MENIAKLELVKKETIDCVQAIKNLFVKFIDETSKNFNGIINDLDSQECFKQKFDDI